MPTWPRKRFGGETLDQDWNEFDLLNMWEQQNGKLHTKWRKVFINHQAIPELLKFPLEEIGWAIEYELIKRLDDILLAVREYSEDSAKDNWIQKRKIELERVTEINNIDTQDLISEEFIWDETQIPPFN